ncbi:MAG TPA: dihydroorotate dehydrogenase electron transfer subunit [Bacillota bacterium]|nr:dihydroorotate dehydrogenase electron transfer subunit [Bacillota bacterium]
MFSGNALITENMNLAPGYYRLSFLAPEVTASAKPGQFIQIRLAVPGSNDPLLPRPISIYQIQKSAGIIAVIYKTVGRGTSLLSGFKTGELIGILGPVGNGFSVPENVRNVALIAGGVGMPPLFCLAESLLQKREDCNISLFYGGRSIRDLLELDSWGQKGVRLFTTTEDGSHGEKGFITPVFLKEHQKQNFDYVAACGPQPMLKAIQDIALTEKIDGELSLEARMACGVGACLGCTCQTHTGYKRVCVDGPVFPIREVAWS